jgi:hypothetical protein
VAYIGNPIYQTAFVTDQFSGTGAQTVFVMSVAPANTASVLVSVHGVVQDPSTYAVSGNSLTFSSAPPTGTGNISCRYLGVPAAGVNTTAYRTVTDFTATSGQTTFSVPSYTVGYIDVYRNGVKLGLADYTASSGTTVVLNNACTAGDLVETVSFYVSSVLNAIPAVAGAVNSNYLATGAVTQTQLQGNNVAGNGPTFSAYLSTSYNVTAGTTTLIPINTKEWDTAGCFNNTNSTVTLNGLSVPAYAFCPNVAGYYQINAAMNGTNFSSYDNKSTVFIYKNGSSYKYMDVNFVGGSGATYNDITAMISCVVYFNGTGDYIQIQGIVNSGSGTPQFGGTATWVNGYLARSAT